MVAGLAREAEVSGLLSGTLAAKRKAWARESVLFPCTTK